MTGFEIQPLPFDQQGIDAWAPLDPRGSNWPVVYVLDDARTAASRAAAGSVYVGETGNVLSRLRQHLASAERGRLTDARVILDMRFNKSVCLDLESFLIRMFAGDGVYQVLNRNDGIVDPNYYDRSTYRETFREVFEALKRDGLFDRTIPEIENSDLFKLSPFKALTTDQSAVVESIVEGLLTDLVAGVRRTTVVQGEPGTGKTIVAIYLLKLLSDVANSVPGNEAERDSVFADFFQPGNRDLMQGRRIGFVIPQQSLRKSVQRVFRKTPGPDPSMVLTPFQVGESTEDFDLLIVDETHRLNQRANQASGPLNKKFRDITAALFGEDDLAKTQLDWITRRSAHQICLVDAAQSVRPADLPGETLRALVDEAKSAESFYQLFTQLRVRAGTDYVGFIRSLLDPGRHYDESQPVTVPDLGEYDLRMFDDIRDMRDAIRAREQEHGLARLVAGYAWEWRSRNDPDAFDIEIDGVQMRWNSQATDWIASARSADEVGSIHTVQGYDLNYAGVIIGPDLRFDVVQRRLVFDRRSYFDKKGMENNPTLGREYNDSDLLRFVANIYAVLLTRGIRGTYVYVCDPELRRHLARYLPRA